MQWSNSRLLKQQTVKETITTRSILTDTTPIAKPHVFNDHEAEAIQRARQIEQSQHQKQMDELKEKIISEAHSQASQIKEAAQKIGFESGQEAGYQQGYQEGMSAGKAAAEDLMNQAEAMTKVVTAAVNQFRKDKQQEMIRYGISIAESLIDQRFTADQESYLPFFETVFRQFEQPDIFVTVRCGTGHVDALRKLLDGKKETITHFRYLLLPDEQLGTHDFKIESDHALTVFELNKEIDSFLHKLLEEGVLNV